MGRFIVGRLLGLIPTMFVIVTISFFVIRLAEGSPFQTDRALPPQVLKDLQEKYGFDQPMSKQYFSYMANLCRGDLGLSTKYPSRTVNEIIKLGFPVTLTIAGVGIIWALLIGVTAGIIAAVRQNTAWDYGAMTAAMLGISIPTFVLGPLLVLMFALSLYVLPPGGWGSWRHIILPGLTLGTIRAAYIARLTRAGTLEVVSSDYVRTA